MFHVTSSTILGIKAIPITVETDISFGMRSFTIVGLADLTVRESRDRIRAALKNTGCSFPRGRITVNLAPADIKKQGPIYDVPIAISLLIASGEISHDSIKDTLILGELALDGTVRPVSGVLSAALMARETGKTIMYVPKSNEQEALCVQGITVFAINDLRSLVDHLTQRCLIESSIKESKSVQNKFSTDLFDIRGQELAKRGLEIAAAGAHNILFCGPPGTGKTLLARSLPSILPYLTEQEAIEVTCLLSVAGELHEQQGLVQTRPFRAPHHSASAVSLVGGGTWPKPGEVSMAHRGVLFLDELPEFSGHVLEHLRQPLEDGYVTISRAIGSVQFPARFLLAAAMNPCPCGFLNDPKHACTCSLIQIQKYTKKISGPLLDRFDLTIDVPNVKISDLQNYGTGEKSQDVFTRVQLARERQAKRFVNTNIVVNNEIPPDKISSWCMLSTKAEQLLQEAFTKQRLSARGYFRIQKVARTIADLDMSDLICEQHIAEALQFKEFTSKQHV